MLSELVISHHEELLCIIFDLIRDYKDPNYFTETFINNSDAYFERAVLKQRWLDGPAFKVKHDCKQDYLLRRASSDFGDAILVA